jgi:NADPH:quinone reductase-like Zn-dependent oxidoreductase
MSIQCQQPDALSLFSDGRTMRAITYATYGSPDMLSLQKIATPQPTDHQVRIDIESASVNAGDWRLLRGSPCVVRLTSGLRRPKHPILGADIAGRVDAVGPNVTRFRPGDAVFADLSGIGYGGFAEYVCVPEDAVVEKPVNLTYEQAAAVPSAAITALQGLRDRGHVEAGQRVLINGASGGVGTFAVQIAKALGAEVTAVCGTRNVELARAIGADHVIDYTQDDVTQHSDGYNLILDAAAYRSLSDFSGILKARGIYVMVGGSGQRYFQLMLKGPWLALRSTQRFGTFVKQARRHDLEYLKDLLEAGQVVPVIDRCYSLREVPTAIRYVEAGNSNGKVVISV